MSVDLDELEPSRTPERKPGQFARHPYTGAPIVNHPTEGAKRTGTKAELIAECAAAGITVPAGATVKVLHDLLGPKPKRVQYGRPSGLGKQIEDMMNVHKWSERMVSLGIALDPELAAEAQALTTLDQNTPEFKKAADAVAVKAKKVAQAHLAADRGTHHHELTEDHDNDRDPVARMAAGEDLGVPRHVQEALVAVWALMLDVLDIEIIATEATCVDDTWRQAGTLDRICRLRRDLTFVTATGEMVTLPAGWAGILDIKTGRLRLDDNGFVAYWRAYSVQLASYAQAVPYDPDTDTRGQWDCEIDQQWAIIAHLDILAALDGEAVCRLFLVDLAAGREAGERCVWARGWERRTDVFSVPMDDLTVRVPVAAPAAITVVPPAGPSDEPQRVGNIVGAAIADIANRPLSRRQWILERVDTVKAAGFAADLVRAWPQGVPGTATDHPHTNDELTAISQALDTVEALHEMPFGDPDPDATARRAEHIEAGRDELEARIQAVVTQLGATEIIEGDQLDEADLAALRAEVNVARPAHRNLLTVWLQEANASGCGFSVSAKPTTRRRAILRAGLALADLCDGLADEADLAIAVLHQATERGKGTVGELLGQLTEDEAITTIGAAAHAPDLALTYTADGPRFVHKIAS